MPVNVPGTGLRNANGTARMLVDSISCNLAAGEKQDAVAITRSRSEAGKYVSLSCGVISELIVNVLCS
jgi:hypothetical protein